MPSQILMGMIAAAWDRRNLLEALNGAGFVCVVFSMGPQVFTPLCMAAEACIIAVLWFTAQATLPRKLPEALPARSDAGTGPPPETHDVCARLSTKCSDDNGAALLASAGHTKRTNRSHHAMHHADS